MDIELTWIHHASFRIAGENVLYIDPWKLDGEPHDADVVFVSHDHYDHFSSEDIDKVTSPDSAIVAPPDVVAKLHKANAVTPGMSLWLKTIGIDAVAAYNVGKEYHPQDNQWCGALFIVGGKRIYYAGDTDLIPEMSELTDVDVALLPVGGTYTLDAAGAAQAVKQIGCDIAIPYHWGDIVGDDADAKAFADQAPCDVRILQPGQSVRL